MFIIICRLSLLGGYLVAKLEDSEHNTLDVYVHGEAEKKNQFSFVCIFFQYLTETGEFFHMMYIRLKESRSISCSTMYISFWHALRVLQRQWHFLFTRSSNELDDYRLMFIVSISLLRKIFNACQNLIYGIVAYTFLNICEKIHQFPSSIERDAHERKSVPLFLPHVHVCTTLLQISTT